jgi:hypothetical protein
LILIGGCFLRSRPAEVRRNATVAVDVGD